MKTLLYIIGAGPLGTLLVGGLATSFGAQMAVGLMSSMLTVVILGIAWRASQLRKV